MRIGIDARVLQTGLRNRGIGIYTHNLIENLIKLNTKHEFVFYIFKNEPIPDLLRDFELILLNPHKRLNFIWQQFTELKADIDLFHTPVALGPTRETILPHFQPKPTVATIYDLNLMNFDDPWSRYFSRTRDYRIQLHSIKRVNKIIAISEYVKRDIIETLHINGDKIEVIYGGVATNIFRPTEDKNSLWSTTTLTLQHNVKSPFLLAVGELPNKNVGVIFRALSKMKKHIQLIVVGKKENCKESHLVKDLALEGRVRFTHEVPQEELIALYNLAEVLVFPSLSEGFGLPPLEAMACGCPVIASNTTSLPEVVGDAAIVIEPDDVSGIINGIKKILEDSNFKERLVNKGFERIKRFSWEKCAKKTLELYEEVAL